MNKNYTKIEKKISQKLANFLRAAEVWSMVCVFTRFWSKKDTIFWASEFVAKV